MKFKKDRQYNIKAADHRGHLGNIAEFKQDSQPLEGYGGKFIGYGTDHGVRVALFQNVGAGDDDDVSTYTVFIVAAIWEAKEVK